MKSARLDSRTLTRTADTIPAHGPRAGRRLAVGLAVGGCRAARRRARRRNIPDDRCRTALLRAAGPIVSGASPFSPGDVGRARFDCRREFEFRTLSLAQ